MTLFHRSGIMVLGRAMPALIGLGGVALYTRLLDPASVGEYALLLSISLLISAVGYSWLRVATLRLGVRSIDESQPPFLQTLGVSFAATALVFAAIEGVAIRVLQPALAWSSLWLAVAGAASIAWFELNGTILQAQLRVVSWSVLNLLRAVAALAATLSFIRWGWKTDAMLAGFLIGNLTTLVYAGLWLPMLRGRFDRALFGQLFAFGWPSSATAALMQISPTFQRYVLNFVGGSAAVGIFAVASDFTSQTLYTIIGSVSLAGIPMAYKAKDEGGPEALRLQLLDNARLIFALAVPAAVGIAALAAPIAEVVFGARFRGGAEAIIILIAFATLAAGLRTYYFDQAFELAFETRPQALISAISVGALMVLCLVLVPRMGAAGAALASLLCSLLWLVLSIVWGRRVLSMPVPVASWLKTAVAAAGMALAIALVPNRSEWTGLATGIILGGFVYVLLSVLMRLDVLRSRFPARFAWLQR